MRLMAAAAALAAVSLVACGSVGSSHETNPPAVPTPTAALARWAAFPAAQKPRLIVWYSDLETTGGGFTGGDAKIAALCNKYSLSTTLPSTLPARATATWTDGTTAIYGAISAADAFTALVKSQPAQTSDMCGGVPPLQITTVSFGTASFRTDRGGAQMSAWLFGSPGVIGMLKYPALSPSAFWKAGVAGPGSLNGAEISPDGLVLTVGFVGAAPASTGVCGADYAPVTAESSAAVAVAVQEIARSVPNGPVVCDLVGHARSLTITLAAPLGGRVVVDAEGNAAPVCPTFKPEC